jgi:L,D-transpeptidase ErfK/SrfK
VPLSPREEGFASPPSAARMWFLRLSALACGLLLAASVAFVALALSGEIYAAHPLSGDPGPEPSEKRAKAARARLSQVRPRGPYIVVDTYANRLRVLQDGEVLRQALCSTGSGVVLRDPRDGRQWIFDSPTGERTIQRKAKNPIWAKPDWAFVEEGYKPPPRDSPDRYDDFSLGNYGLYMGDGYIIHGTIFQSLLGRRVTHGCIRLGDEDLEWVYKQVPVGARVYLY